MPGGKQPQVMHLSTKSKPQQAPIKINQTESKAINLSTQNKPPEPIKLSTGSKLPKKTADVKPVRRRAQPIGTEGIPSMPSGSSTTSGVRREVIPSRETPGDSEEPPVKNLVEGVLSDLDDVIESKYKEYNDFCNALLEEDELNRAMLTDEQIAAEVKSSDEDPMDKLAGPTEEISEADAFKEPELDPMEIAMGVGNPKQKDYNSYKKSKSIFDTKPVLNLKQVDPKDIPQVKTEEPRYINQLENGAALPFLLKKEEDGTLVQAENIEDLANEQIKPAMPYPSFNIHHANYDVDPMPEIEAKLPDIPDTSKPKISEEDPNATVLPDFPNVLIEIPPSKEELEDAKELLQKTAGPIVDKLEETVPEFIEAIANVPIETLDKFFDDQYVKENTTEKESSHTEVTEEEMEDLKALVKSVVEENSKLFESIKKQDLSILFEKNLAEEFQEVDEINQDTKEEKSSEEYTTLDELLNDFEMSEEDKTRMAEITKTMTLSPEDRAKLAVQQKMQAEPPVEEEEVQEEVQQLETTRTIVNPAESLAPDASIFADIDDEDFKELDEDEEVASSEDLLEDENMKQLQQEIAQKIQPVAAKFDISTFQIVNKPVSYQSAIQTQETNERVTDWVLMSSNRHIAFTSFSGPQLERINPNAGGRNALNSIRTQWQEIYEHVVDPFKPKTVENWAKTIYISDVDNVYMGIYVANFMDSNFIPYTCEHCKNMFLSDNMSILDMLKYKNDAAKEKFRRLYEAEPTEASALIPAQIVPISDTIAVGIKNPTIYDVMFETAALDQKFRDKYEEVLALMVYIDRMYKIDLESGQIFPIAVKEYPNNMAKSIKAKIITYSKVMNSLNADSYSLLRACIRNMVDTVNDEITFEKPEVQCKKCGTVIPKEAMTAVDLLFTRHQLATLATM